MTDKKEPELTLQPKKKKMGNPNLKKGVVLNPKGRPKGSLNKYTALSRELLSTKGPEIVNKVIEMALEGDRTCLKMCMDRIVPVSKAVELRSSSKEGGGITINVGQIEAKVVEAEETKPLEYEEGVIVEDKQIEETVIKIGKNINE